MSDNNFIISYRVHTRSKCKHTNALRSYNNRTAKAGRVYRENQRTAEHIIYITFADTNESQQITRTSRSNLTGFTAYSGMSFL